MRERSWEHEFPPGTFRCGLVSLHGNANGREEKWKGFRVPSISGFSSLLLYAAFVDFEPGELSEVEVAPLAVFGLISSASSVSFLSACFSSSSV
jgi:hypothetical protein